jgi:hypothetical protein
MDVAFLRKCELKCPLDDETFFFVSASNVTLLSMSG